MDITELLAFSVKNGASDLHLSAGMPPMIRVDGEVRRINLPALEHKEVHRLVYDIMNDKQRRDFEEQLETDFSFEVPGVARFRVNAFNQNRGAGAVFRTIPSKVLTMEDLGLGQIFKDLCDLPRGLILVTGPTGSGKSTTLASMIDFINDNRYDHILTVEDPIEFVHQSKKCLINQREVHRDTHGFNEALRSALREDPDIILVGEMRDLETIRLALTAAETGHLVFGTLHTTSAAKTIDRVIDVFPAEEKDMVRAMLSESLQAVISQTLLKKNGGGRVAAHEIMIGIPAIRNLIRENKVAQMYSAIQTGANYGMTTLDQSLKALVAKGKASDLFITADVEPSMKINGQIVPVVKTKLNGEIIMQLLNSIMSEKQRKEFADTRECNFAITNRDKTARFRVSAFQQRDMPGMVLRRIETKIPTMEELKLPPILKDLAMTKRGIIIFVGATGTGKSTSLASIIGYRNQNSKGHIITIEDPIEFVHEHAGCIITQREVGIDTDSFEIALKNTLRQAPDVILIGEIRSRETMDYAIAFAETGHLVFATLHANNANQAIDRIIHFFESDRHSQLFMDLSLNLKAMVAQQLIPTPDGNSRRAAIEILINSPLVSDLIRKGDVHEIKDLMKRSRELGMQTFDQALFDLYKAGQITYKDALKHADSPNDLRLQIKLDEEGGAQLLNANSKLTFDGQ
ncbi:hypothetical protein FQR65_LT16134 [Abscondita terminalis]|nr:hypothetical protein FQR65_LT16134 [Abscondita terminalis]